MASAPTRRPRWHYLVASTLITLTLAVPASMVVLPRVHQWQMVRALGSDDPAVRQRGLNYLARHAPGDADLQRRVVERLPRLDEADFIAVVDTLNLLGLWRRPPVDDASWFRWLSAELDTAGPADAEVLPRLANRLADLSDIPTDPRLLTLLRELTTSPTADVRLNGLVAAAELAGAAEFHGLAAAPLVTLIGELTRDSEPRIRREAWVILGLLDPTQGFTADFSAEPPEVAQAIMWAAAATTGRAPRSVVETLHGDDPDRAAVAAFALHWAQAPPGEPHPLDTFIASASTAAPPTLALWRAVLATPSPAAPAALLATIEQADDPAWEAVRLAALYRVGLGAGHALPAPLDSESAILRALSLLEGTPPGSVPIAFTADMPPMVRLAALRAAAAPDPAAAQPLVGEDAATLRDLAVTVGTRGLTDDQALQLSQWALREFNDDAKLAGGMLAGLRSLRPTALSRPPGGGAATEVELVSYWAQFHPSPEVRRVMRLAQWLRGEPVRNDEGQPIDMAQAAEAMLTLGPESPRSTALLALLHRGRPAAWEFLLAPRGEPEIDLPDLLDQRRWWRVLAAYLPQAPGPRPDVWFWADADVVGFQADVLRNWYLVHRVRLRAGATEGPLQHGATQGK